MENYCIRARNYRVGQYATVALASTTVALPQLPQAPPKSTVALAVIREDIKTGKGGASAQRVSATAQATGAGRVSVGLFIRVRKHVCKHTGQ